jgi:site-specific DNA recombinase
MAKTLRSLATAEAGPDVLAYLRVSTTEQAREGKSSIVDQQHAVEQLATRLGRTLTAPMTFADPGVSGQTAEDRPGFMAMVKYCETHPRSERAAGYVLMLNDSRLGRFRNPEESAYWRVLLRRLGWIVRFAEGDETEDMVGRTVMRAIGGAQATQYITALKANAKRGARGAATRGLWQTEAPLGYRRLATRAGSAPQTLGLGERKADDQEVRLTLGPANEVALVRWIFDTYASGTTSMGELARQLVTRWPGRKWCRQTVRAILRNPAYVGDVVWCKRPADKQERRETWRRPESEWVTTPDAHPAIVDRDLFHRVQTQIARNARELRSTGGGYPLSGLIRCAQCGSPYIGGGGVLGPENDRDRYRFYKCRGGDGARHTCERPLGTLQKRWVEPIVIDEIAKVVEHPAVEAIIAEELDRALGATTEGQAEQRAGLERERTTLATQRDNLVGAVARCVLTDEDAGPALARNREETARVASALERIKFAERNTARIDGERDRLLALAHDFRGAAGRMTGAALRELLRPWLASAVMDKKARTLTLSIRRVPACGLMLLETGPARGSP